MLISKFCGPEAYVQGVAYEITNRAQSSHTEGKNPSHSGQDLAITRRNEASQTRLKGLLGFRIMIMNKMS